MGSEAAALLLSAHTFDYYCKLLTPPGNTFTHLLPYDGCVLMHVYKCWQGVDANAFFRVWSRKSLCEWNASNVYSHFPTIYCVRSFKYLNIELDESPLNYETLNLRIQFPLLSRCHHHFLIKFDKHRDINICNTTLSKMCTFTPVWLVLHGRTDETMQHLQYHLF